MARLKVELSYPHAEREEWKEEVEDLIFEVDRHLRDRARGEEWAVSGGAREWRNEEEDEKYRTTSVYCEVYAIDERWPGIRELLDAHDLLEHAVVTGTIEDGEGWAQIWPN